MSNYARKMKRNVEKIVEQEVKRLYSGKKVSGTRFPCPYTHVMCEATDCSDCDTYKEANQLLKDIHEEKRNKQSNEEYLNVELKEQND